MDASTEVCEVRQVLQEVLEAHPAYETVPSRMMLSDGRTLSVRYQNGHIVRYENGEEYIVIHHHNGDITLVANHDGGIEAVSRRDGLLQGVDRLPKHLMETLKLIANLRDKLN